MTQEEKEIYANIFKVALKVSQKPEYAEFAMYIFKAIKEVGGATSDDFTHGWEYLKKYNEIEDTVENWQEAIDEMGEQTSAFARRLDNLIVNEISRKMTKGAQSDNRGT